MEFKIDWSTNSFLFLMSTFSKIPDSIDLFIPVMWVISTRMSRKLFTGSTQFD